MKRVSIIGFGRFGKTLYRLLKDNHKITVYDIDPKQYKDFDFKQGDNTTTDLKEVYTTDTVFYAVPIRELKKVIQEHKQYIDKQLLIDVLSVKKLPETIFKKELPEATAILTHPMFGPDSSKDGFPGLPMIMDRFTATDGQYAYWKEYFTSKELNVVEISADEHDKLAAKSQGVAHFVGRLLEKYNMQETQIDSNAAKMLQTVMDLAVNDTWELFESLQVENPYTKQMRIDIGEAYEDIHKKLLPERINQDTLTVGIQGGKGSFNEEAARYYLTRSGIKNFKLVYLYTTENVLKALHEGDIDRGQFAIHNSTGGLVKETVEAMSRYRFDIVEEFGIKIEHTLMCHPDCTLKDIGTIMTHPQVLKQCKENLAQKYSNLNLTSGEGELIDHANVAKAIHEGNIPNTTATLASKVLAKIYGLNIIEEGLQDLSDNFTSFLWVKRQA